MTAQNTHPSARHQTMPDAQTKEYRDDHRQHACRKEDVAKRPEAKRKSDTHRREKPGGAGIS